MLSKHNASDENFDEPVNRQTEEMVLQRASEESGWAELNKINMTPFFRRDETSVQNHLNILGVGIWCSDISKQ